jgi:hypothetical protein
MILGPPLGLINVGKKERFSHTLQHSFYFTKERKEKKLAKPDSMTEDGGEEGE